MVFVLALVAQAFTPVLPGGMTGFDTGIDSVKIGHRQRFSLGNQQRYQRSRILLRDQLGDHLFVIHVGNLHVVAGT